jgi:adenylate kinase family enzyme
MAQIENRQTQAFVGRDLRRIAVVGTSGSGKTTLARRLAECLEIPHVELDALHWGPNWTPAAVEEFRERVAQALAGDTWTTDGNYGKVRDIVWGLADTVVWLDYSLPIVLTRVIRRTLRRSICREELWSGNRERLGASLFTRDSIIRWTLRTYGRRRSEYPLLFGQPEYAHLRFVRLGSPRATRAWLDAVAPADRARYSQPQAPLPEQREGVHGQDANPCHTRPG